MHLVLKSGHAVIIDDDCDRLSNTPWRYSKHGNKDRGDKCYVSAKVCGKHVYLHRVVMGARRGQMVDHINGDTLDNRKSNLRFVTARQNMQNRAKPSPDTALSRFKGVTGSVGKKWRAFIRDANGKQKYLGMFVREVEAAFAYDLENINQFGEFGKRNFLPLVLQP